MERVHQPTPDMRANLEYLTDDLEEPYALIGHVRFGEGHRALLILQSWRIYFVYSQNTLYFSQKQSLKLLSIDYQGVRSSPFCKSLFLLPQIVLCILLVCDIFSLLQ